MDHYYIGKSLFYHWFSGPSSENMNKCIWFLPTGYPYITLKPIRCFLLKSLKFNWHLSLNTTTYPNGLNYFSDFRYFMHRNFNPCLTGKSIVLWATNQFFSRFSPFNDNLINFEGRKGWSWYGGYLKEKLLISWVVLISLISKQESCLSDEHCYLEYICHSFCYIN